MTHEEYEAIRAQIRLRYDQDMAAVDRVWELSGNRREPPVSTSASVSPSASASPSMDAQPSEPFSAFKQPESRLAKGTVDRYVRWAVNDFGPNRAFNHRDVAGAIDHRWPMTEVKRESIASVLSRLTRLGALEVLQAGAGTRATSYRLRPVPIPDGQEDDPEDTPM